MVSEREKICLSVFSTDLINDRVIYILRESLQPETFKKLLKFKGRHVSELLRELDGSDNSTARSR